MRIVNTIIVTDRFHSQEERSQLGQVFSSNPGLLTSIKFLGDDLIQNSDPLADYLRLKSNACTYPALYVISRDESIQIDDISSLGSALNVDSVIVGHSNIISGLLTGDVIRRVNEATSGSIPEVSATGTGGLQRLDLGNVLSTPTGMLTAAAAVGGVIAP